MVLSQPPPPGLIACIERSVGGRVTAAHRQGERRSGGRPAWYVDLATEAGDLPLYARMQRPENRDRGAALRREFAVLSCLYDQGVRVPRVHALCDDPLAIVMQRLRGDDDLARIADAGRRESVGEQFIEQLSLWHSLPIEPFVAIGLTAPASAEQYALSDLAYWEKIYRRTTRQAVPFLEFVLRWLRSHVPAAPSRPSLLQGDTGPGQFLYDGDQLTGVVDWEFAHLGDPMLDLAYVVNRDYWNKGADLRQWFASYRKRSGIEIDWSRVAYYMVKAGSITPLSLAGIVQTMPLGVDHAEWHAQYLSYARLTAEALAQAEGIELEPVELPPDAEGPTQALALLEHDLREQLLPAIDDPFLRQRIGMDLRLLRHLRNVDAIGAQIAAAEAEDLAELAGRRRADPLPASELVALVEHAHASDAPRWIRYFHRHFVRSEALWRGALGAGEGATLARLDTLR
jgi:aminoglycoside phosphotransferase (APT) family kinase protein